MSNKVIFSYYNHLLLRQHYELRSTVQPSSRPLDLKYLSHWNNKPHFTNDWLLLSFRRWMMILWRLSDISTSPFRKWSDVPYCFPVSAPKLSSTIHQHISEQTVSCFPITCLLHNESIMQKETKCFSQRALSPSKSRCACQQVPQKTILDKQYPKKMIRNT